MEFFRNLGLGFISRLGLGKPGRWEDAGDLQMAQSNALIDYLQERDGDPKESLQKMAQGDNADMATWAQQILDTWSEDPTPPQT